MGTACAIFGWSEEQFWRSTPHAFFAAVEGYRLANDSDYRQSQGFAEFKRGLEDAGVA
jgi:hypothetical protein